jgi:peptidoglycan/xylan/chitin deacetylase (PgdA/CDA1 family)
MFSATHPSAALDALGVPYAADGAADGDGAFAAAHPLAGAQRLAVAADGGRSLYWPRGEALASAGGVRGAYRFGTIPIFGQVLPDAAAERLVRAAGPGFAPTDAVTDADGARVASVWRGADGSVVLPFDPDEVVHTYVSEDYQAVARGEGSQARSALARRAYYTLRPLIPRPLQIAMRRVHSRVRMRSTFPAWPVEPCLHDLLRAVLGLAAEVAREPVPYLAAWPSGRTSAVVLTHDVETDVGYGCLDLMMERERRAGFRSSWNFVPERYAVSDERVRALVADGFEVGLHGLRHDGRDLESLATLQKRLPAMRSWAERWGAVGFRSPATQRGYDLIPVLGFDYDSSYPDTDPFEPQGGGCCSYLPFFNRDTVELPITLPQDHTLFEILGHEDETAWIEKLRYLRQAGGMSLLITHPDYMRSDARLDAYSRFLEQAGAETSTWRALPREVSAWWRRRAASRIERSGAGWVVTGPAAADAVVALAAPA